MLRAHVALFATSAVWLFLPDAAHAQAVRRSASHGQPAASRPMFQSTPMFQSSPMFQSTPMFGSTSMFQSTPMFQPTPVVQARPALQRIGGTGPSLNIPGYSYLQSPLNDYYDHGSGFFGSSGQGFRHYTHGFAFFDSPPPGIGTRLRVPPLRGVGGPSPQGARGPVIRQFAPQLPLIARLSVQFPAAAEVWMDGERQPGRRATWELNSLPLPHPWSAHMFDVAARWSVGGQTFEWENKVPVVAGHTGQALVARGSPVKP